MTPAAGPAARTGFRLRRRAFKTALVAHVLSSVGWFGVAVVVAFCGFAAAASSHAQAHAYYRAMESVTWLSISAGVVAAATGILLGLGTSHGLVRQWWVVAKMVIAVAVIVTDALLVQTVARDAAATGEPSRALYGSTAAHVVVLAAATVLSVFKPRGLTPWGRNRTPAARHRRDRAPAV